MLVQEQRQGSRNSEDDFLLTGVGGQAVVRGGRGGDERIFRGSPTELLEGSVGFGRAGVKPSRMKEAWEDQI